MTKPIARMQTVGRTVFWLMLVLYFAAPKVNGEDLEEIQVDVNAIGGTTSDESNKSVDFSTQNDTEESDKVIKPRFGKSSDDSLGMDSLTIIWYLTTFTALLGFFVVMACTENSCGRARNSKPAENVRTCPPTPCPSYKNFAPPSYDSVMKKYKNPRVFIVPVHENNNFFNQNVSESHSVPTCIQIEKRSEISER